MAKGVYINKTQNVERFFNDARKIDMANVEETTQLVHLIQNGSEKEKVRSRNRLVEANMRYMSQFAAGYQFLTDLEFGDLLSEATFGMINAAETFNPKKGAFTTHAKQQMRASLQAAIEKNKGTISLPTNQARLLSKIKKAQNRYFNENCYNPSSWELAELLGENEKDIDKCLSSNQSISSIDKKFGDGDEDGSLVDVYENVNSLQADHLVSSKDKAYYFEKAISTLSEKEKFVFCSLNGFSGYSKMGEDDLAKEMGYTSTESVRLLKKKAQTRLATRYQQGGLF